MFLELHLSDDNEKIIVNINRINSIYSNKGVTYIYVGEAVYRVKESYEDVTNCIDKYYKP
jgi:hypothetical protein